MGSIGSDTVGNLSFAGEQWRTSSSALSNTLTFWYRVSPAPLTSPEPGVTNNWTPVTNLDFTSPVVLGTGVPLNGNQSSNRQIFASFLLQGLAVPPGQSVFFRWHDPNDSGTDQRLAVDDLAVDFSALRPRITSAVVSNGIVQLTGVGESNLTYGIEAATNLVPPVFWQRIGSNTADAAGGFQVMDPNALAFPQRYYRALFP